MTFAVIFALAAGFSNAVNVLTQHKASISAPTRVKGWRLALYLPRQPLWLLGVAAAVGSFAFQALALHNGPDVGGPAAAGHRTDLCLGAAPGVDSPGRGPRRLGVGRRRLCGTGGVPRRGRAHRRLRRSRGKSVAVCWARRRRD